MRRMHLIVQQIDVDVVILQNFFLKVIVYHMRAVLKSELP